MSRQGMLAEDGKGVRFDGPPTGTLQDLGRRLSQANFRRIVPHGARIGDLHDKLVSFQAASAFSRSHLFIAEASISPRQSTLK
jgi:hypothetical protein